MGKPQKDHRKIQLAREQRKAEARAAHHTMMKDRKKKPNHNG